jgi:hypothetical protein
MAGYVVGGRWALVCAFSSCAPAVFGGEVSFQFSSIKSLDDMSAFIRNSIVLGAPRQSLQTIFVKQGMATLVVHPQQPGTEKYIYDINLCDYYVWRWNISADFDAENRLKQAYVNGDIVYTAGTARKVRPQEPEAGKSSSVTNRQRPRPEAYKGEKSLGYMLFDRDNNMATTDDQSVMGVGPSRADPLNMGDINYYSAVELWRSIFDADEANHISEYQGDCVAVARILSKRKDPPKK